MAQFSAHRRFVVNRGLPRSESRGQTASRPSERCRRQSTGDEGGAVLAEAADDLTVPPVAVQKREFLACGSHDLFQMRVRSVAFTFQCG